MSEPIHLTRDGMEDIVIETQNADGSMRDLGDVLGDLRSGFGQLTASQKMQNAEMISGKTG